MNLFLLTDGIPPYVMGGMQKHSRLIAEHSARNGIRVVLYHCFPSAQPIANDVALHSFSKEAQENITIRGFEYDDTGWVPGHYLRSQRELSLRYFNQLKTEKSPPTFIYTKGFVGSEIIRRRNELPFQSNIGVKFHGMNMFQAQPDLKGELTKFLLRAPVRKLMNSADVVFSYGGDITRLIKNEVTLDKLVFEMPSGIDQGCIVKHVAAANDERRFVFVGRYDRLKGLPELYEAIDQISDFNWSLAIVGPVPSEHQKVHERIRYVGSLSSQEEVFKVLDQADALICPSISEGMPNVILEAMARGLAVIATDVGATSLMIDGNGILIKPKRQDQIVEAMLSVMNATEIELLEMKKRSLDLMRSKFTWNAIIKPFIEFLSKQQLSE
ncbi:MAG: glycosyltransferase family 4 protein [Flavobacteriales bacterium]|nr:glycosyltransferase family 4 protein [Flavobacteriales bacterium]